MCAGELRHRVTLQARGIASDALGGQVQTWLDVATVWADVEPLSARALMAAQANRSELTHMVTIRYQVRFADPLYMATLRILYGKRGLNINGAIDVGERHKFIELLCSEGLNNG